MARPDTWELFRRLPLLFRRRCGKLTAWYKGRCPLRYEDTNAFYSTIIGMDCQGLFQFFYFRRRAPFEVLSKMGMDALCRGGKSAGQKNPKISEEKI